MSRLSDAELLPLLVSDLPLGVLVVDEAGAVRLLNPEAQRQYGAPAGTLQPASFTWTDADGRRLEPSETPLARALRGETVEEQRVALHAVGQSPGWVWCGARPLRHGGAVVAAVLLTRSAADSVDAERARQAAEAANRMKDEFLAMVSHELRTPLHAVLGWASILRQRKADPRAWEKGLEAIERNARVQAKLVEDLLDLSRIVSGKLHVALRPMDPLPTLQAAVDVVRPTSEAKGVALEVSTEAAAGCTVSGDPDRLQQVVWNLLVNAVKFTPAGGRVELRAGCEGGQLAIEVRDTGEGIPPDFMPFLFERFRQAHTGPVRTQLGLGLGLALVRHVVELHGGGVSAQSAGPGQGSTFRVVLRLLTAPGAGPP